MDFYGMPSVSSDYFAIDDLLDFPSDEFFSTSSYCSSTTSSSDLRCSHHSPLPVIPFASHNPTLFSPDFDFTDGLYVPNDEVAELEWLSQFVDDSFSDFNFTEGTREKSLQQGNSSSSGKTRRKGTGKLSVQVISPEPEPMSTGKLKSRTETVPENFSFASTCSSMITHSPGGRKCSHCSSEKTPQWRTGPLGPKTLCNACGVRFKSGRLVPEYRPAASPTFVLTEHSNSHRKVLELRRQKELSRKQPPQQMEEKFYAQAYDFQVC